MKYLLLILALLSAPAHAARYSFDFYVETNRWVCSDSCYSNPDTMEMIPPPALEYAALEGNTYTGYFTLTGTTLDRADVWLNLPLTTYPIATLRWSDRDNRYAQYGSMIHYLDFDLASGLGEYYFEDDAYPYYRLRRLSLSNISEVPLPASGSLLLAGLGALILRRRLQRAL